jgi:hypothetical protein
MTTAIEALVAQANAEEGSPGYHITATFSDGSVIDAPILRVGPDWMTVSEIQADPYMVLLRDATNLQINWAPGAAYAEGPRFSDVAPSSSAPRM